MQIFLSVGIEQVRANNFVLIATATPRKVKIIATTYFTSVKRTMEDFFHLLSSLLFILVYPFLISGIKVKLKNRVYTSESWIYK